MRKLIGLLMLLALIATSRSESLPQCNNGNTTPVAVIEVYR